MKENSNIEAETIPDLPLKRKTRVSPWKNKEEFEMVYNWLYGDEVNSETKEKAYKRMLVWKLRRVDLTPASVLSTLIIVEVQLKDNFSITESNGNNNDLRIIYSSALTRFLNYMSSIMQTRNMSTMYVTAKKLGLESFMVDLRHLCAHGQSMPSLEIFRRTADYCIKWVKEFYWDHEKKYMQNVDAKHIRQEDRTVFDDNISELFLTYDSATEAIFKGCTIVTQAKKILVQDTYGILKKYSNLREEKGLNDILSLIIKDLSALVKREVGLKDVQQIYVSAFLKMTFFFQVAAQNTDTYEERGAIIKLHQQLFRAVAFFGFIEGLFRDLMSICENTYDIFYRRKGASFWANQIVVGFVVFRDFKLKYKDEKEKNPDINLDLSTLNSAAMSKDVLRFYHNMNIDINSTLIFGDTFRRPWSLSFTRSFIEERIENINEFTMDIIKNCLSLIVPPLKETDLNILNKLIDVYFNRLSDSAQNEDDVQARNTQSDVSNIYSLQKDVFGCVEDIEMMDVDSHLEEQTFGIWSTLPGGQDWNTCPLGRLPWD